MVSAPEMMDSFYALILAKRRVTIDDIYEQLRISVDTALILEEDGSVTFRSLAKQTTTRNIYNNIYIYFLDERLYEVGAVRRGIRIVRL